MLFKYMCGIKTIAQSTNSKGGIHMLMNSTIEILTPGLVSFVAECYLEIEHT